MNATKSKSDAVRERAQRRVQKHTGTRGDLTRVAGILGVGVPTVLRWRRGVLPVLPYARIILERLAS